MAVTYRASTSTNTGSTPASSITIDVPTGVQAGDMIFVTILIDGGSGATITPAVSGWLEQAQSNEGTNQGSWSAYRMASASEPANYTFNFDTARAACGGMLAYSGTFYYLGAGSAIATATPGTNMVVSAQPAGGPGTFIHIFGGRNTTAAASMSTGSGMTERIDTSTSSTPFLNLDVQESAYRPFPPINTTSTGAITSTQSVSQITKTIFIPDARPQRSLLTEDFYANSAFTTARTSQAIGIFKTTYANELIVIVATIRGGSTTVSSVTSSGTYGWTRRARANTNAGCVEIWTAVSTGANAGITPTVNYSGSTVSGANLMFGIIGADVANGPVGATLTDVFSAGTYSNTLASTRANSLMIIGLNHDTTSTPATAGSGFNTIWASGDSGIPGASVIQRMTDVIVTKGTAQTINPTLPASSSGNIAVVEVIPALTKPGTNMSGMM